MTTTLHHRLHPTILRECDIRGIVGQTLDGADAFAIGQAFGTLAGGQGVARVALARDGRLSSPELAEAACRGLLSAGMDVVDLGLGPSPLLYFGVRHLGLGAGLMVTGSHNPKDHNGFKPVLQNRCLDRQGIELLGRLCAEGPVSRGSGHRYRMDLTDAYLDRLLVGLDTTALPPAVWDAGNGATGPLLRRLLARLPGGHRLMYDQVDGTFPNHHPDPSIAANLTDLSASVVAGRFGLGVAFDGDGDRIGAVDGRGRTVCSDRLLALFARDLLGRHPGATIIADVKSSQVLFDIIAAAGGRPLMWKTGRSLLKAKMDEVGALLAGEVSGHILFADRHEGYDDALYCALRLLELVGLTGPLDRLCDALPTLLTTPEIRIPVPDEDKFTLMEAVARGVRMEPGQRIDDTDGVRVSTADGWWLLRASNTQGALVARAEAGTAEGLARLTATIGGHLRAIGLDLPAWR